MTPVSLERFCLLAAPALRTALLGGLDQAGAANLLLQAGKGASWGHPLLGLCSG